MCGIVFNLNTPDSPIHKADEFLRDALLASQVRGTDGTGLFQIDKDNKAVWHKAGMNASDFLRYKQTKDELLAANFALATVGHVRAATVGGVSTDTSHPFMVEREDGTSIIGVHNGTIPLWRGRKDASKFSVDSHWIFHMLATEGHDAFEHIDGAFALIWYDDLYPNSIFMTRNKERPLHFMVTEDGKSILGASEVGMLGWCAERNGLKPEKGKTCYYLEDHLIYEFDLLTLKYKVWDRPKYDSRIAYAHSNYNHMTAYNPPGRQMSRSLYDDEYDEDYYGSTGVMRTPWYDSTCADDLADQERTLALVKEALADARGSTDGSEWEFTPDPDVIDAQVTIVSEKTEGTTALSVVTSDDLERAMHHALSSMSKKEDPRKTDSNENPFQPDIIDRGSYWIGPTSGKAANRAESEAATEAKLSGLLVRFNGLEYDEDTSTCIGEAKTTIDGKPVTLEGEIRFITQAEAHRKYIDPTFGFAVLIGLRLSENWAVFEPVSDSQEINIKDYLAADLALERDKHSTVSRRTLN